MLVTTMRNVEIDLTRFLKACEEYCAEEDLDNALKMTEKSLDRADRVADHVFR